MMKKQYIQPSTKVVLMKSANLLSGSPTGSDVYDSQAGEGVGGLGRYDGFWDDDDSDDNNEF